MAAPPEPGADAGLDAARIDARLEALEIKASYAEDLLDRLNELVVRQQQQIDALVQEVLALRQQTRQRDPDGLPRGPLDERPPHY